MTCSAARASLAARMARACPTCGPHGPAGAWAAAPDAAFTSVLKKGGGDGAVAADSFECPAALFAVMQEGR